MDEKRRRMQKELEAREQKARGNSSGGQETATQRSFYFIFPIDLCAANRLQHNSFFPFFIFVVVVVGVIIVALPRPQRRPK
jgi:hypothetical protein